jgi:hypothetical protein
MDVRIHAELVCNLLLAYGPDLNTAEFATYASSSILEDMAVRLGEAKCSV